MPLSGGLRHYRDISTITPGKIRETEIHSRVFSSEGVAPAAGGDLPAADRQNADSGDDGRWMRGRNAAAASDSASKLRRPKRCGAVRVPSHWPAAWLARGSRPHGRVSGNRARETKIYYYSDGDDDEYRVGRAGGGDGD